MKPCPYDRREIPYEPRMGKEALHHGGLSPVFLEWVLEEDLGGKSILDLGCGKGRLAFALAPHAASVLGLDWDEEAIQRARERARDLGLTHLSFRVADVEAIEYSEVYLKEWGWPPDLIVSHLCMSPAIIARSGRALRPGCPFIFAAFHKDQWRETGRPSRFALSEEEVEEELEKAGLRPEKALVEQEVLTFCDPASAEGVLFSEGFLPAKWRADGRADGLRGYLREGGTRFTRKSHILIKARRL
jgi:SAM-dependent methyltransferase